MRTDYKFWFIRRDDSGYITEAAIKFYEGDFSTALEKIAGGLEKPVYRYQRNKRLSKDELGYLGKVIFIKDTANQEAVLYTFNDFGWIKTDDELRDFLNKELAKDKSRVAIDEQKLK